MSDAPKLVKPAERSTLIRMSDASKLVKPVERSTLIGSKEQPAQDKTSSFFTTGVYVIV